MISDPQGIKQYAVYDHPDDYPYGFVVREWFVTSTGDVQAGEARTAASLEEARSLIPPGAERVSGQDPSEPKIVEVWI